MIANESEDLFPPEVLRDLAVLRAERERPPTPSLFDLLLWVERTRAKVSP